ncbi:hypothetical protein TNCV_4522021, partial [Trichonephila clavipes]
LPEGFDNGPRNYEPWSSDVTTPELAPNYPPHQREDVSALDRFNVHRYHGGSLVYWHEPVTKSKPRSDTYTTRLPRPPIL